MSTTTVTVDSLGFDPASLSKATVNAMRAGLGIIGIAAVALGIALVAQPTTSWKVFVMIASIYFAVSGLVRVALGIFSREVGVGYRLANIILGVLLLLGGIYMLKNSLAAAFVGGLVFAILIGASWIIEGVLTLVSVGNGSQSKWGILTGIVSIIAGIVVLVLPLSSLVLVIAITGIFLIVSGILGLVQAFTLGKAITAAA